MKRITAPILTVLICIAPPLAMRYYDLTPQQYDLIAIGIFVGAVVTATVLISTYCILEDND